MDAPRAHGFVTAAKCAIERRPDDLDAERLRHDQDQRRQFLRGFPPRPDLRHATPRTLTGGDFSLYTALFGGRFAVHSSAEFAKAIGYPGGPIDDLLVFHIVFGKTVTGCLAQRGGQLGYAGMHWLAPVYRGRHASATSEVIGLKENTNRKTGIVYVRTRGVKQNGTAVLEYVRWVMVESVTRATPAPDDMCRGCRPWSSRSFSAAPARRSM